MNVDSQHRRPGGSPLLGAQDLGVRLAGRWLVRGVDLCVYRGEIVTLIGPNGGGKTTTIKALLGIVPMHEGRLQRAAGLRIGYVPQRIHIEATLPLNVTRFMSLTARHTPQQVHSALATVGIESLAGDWVQNLSGGEFQRLLLARAMLREPDLLILDEPVQNVDFAGEIALYELIHRIRDQLGCGILLISHDLNIVMAQTDRVVCLNGHVCCDGTPQRVAASPQYRTLFGPRAAEALAIYQHHHDHRHLPDGSVVPVGEPPRSLEEPPEIDRAG